MPVVCEQNTRLADNYVMSITVGLYWSIGKGNTGSAVRISASSS